MSLARLPHPRHRSLKARPAEGPAHQGRAGRGGAGMSGMLPYLGALALFLFGLRLTAFFSGAETGFYRASYLRVSIDAQSGDPIAKRILWFCQNPTNFVVTALIGNN